MKAILALAFILALPVSAAMVSCRSSCLEAAEKKCEELINAGVDGTQATQIAAQYYRDCAAGCGGVQAAPK